MRPALTPDACLPRDADRALLVGRVWVPELGGPVLVRADRDTLYDLTAVAPTSSDLCNLPDPAGAIERAGPLPRLAALADVLSNTPPETRRPDRPWLLAPCDLQAVKASGVTFVASLLERVIEEQARGDANRADALRQSILAVIGQTLHDVRPGSAHAAELKQLLVDRGVWSQYLEVGIGPDAEIFTKAQPMSAVGTGVEAGIHAKSAWNNPEPEIVLAVSGAGPPVGAALGNDVNLRDFEGRSALLLGKAKDNNASCAIGPFIRLFDGTFGMDEVRNADLALHIEGADGFSYTGRSSMAEISRDPADLVAQTIGPNHQYPDGLMLFLGTMFAPTVDRSAPGQGFTHLVGDIVTVATPALGALVNRMNYSEVIEPWTFGTGALMRNLAKRGVI